MINARILVVDDEKPDLLATCRVLRNAGYEVLSAETGAEALRLTHERQPDLLLLDVNLPDISGLEVCRQLKAEAELGNVFVVMLSAINTDTDSQASGLESGADGYIVRPIANRELLARVEAMLRIKAAEQALRKYSESLEIMVAERTAELRALNLSLEKAVQSRDEFLSAMSHELRTPLSGILGMSEVLQLPSYGELSPKQLRAVEAIKSSGKRLLELIDDILDLSLIQTDTLSLQISPCQVDSICKASLQAVESAAQRKGQRVNYTRIPVDVYIQADPRRFKQMLVNLLDNAVKFTPEAGALGLDVDMDEQQREIRLAVWDRGIGIKPEDMEKLFQSFTQVDGRLAREYGGTGLGLTLVDKLARMHGGRVEVESVFGQGSTFTIILPWQE